jgi:hypothetical protein
MLEVGQAAHLVVSLNQRRRSQRQEFGNRRACVTILDSHPFVRLTQETQRLNSSSIQRARNGQDFYEVQTAQGWDGYMDVSDVVLDSDNPAENTRNATVIIKDAGLDNLCAFDELKRILILLLLTSVGPFGSDRSPLPTSCPAGRGAVFSGFPVA